MTTNPREGSAPRGRERTTGLRVDALTFRRSGRLVIDHVDCTVAAGAVGVLVGPNGAGKSTLLHAVAHVLDPDSGSVLLGGEPIGGMSRRSRARRIALVQQNLGGEAGSPAGESADLTVLEAVLLARFPHLPLLATPGAADRRIALDALARVGASELASRRFASLSGGERQRVLLARAVAQQPVLLLADEPTNHLDIRAQLETIGLLQKLATDGVAVLTAMHDLALAATCADTVIVLDRGRVVAAGPPTTTLTPRLIEDVYGVGAEVGTDGRGRPRISYFPL